MISKFYLNFFKNKKILITGNSGFIGSYLSLTLSLMGSKVFGYSLIKKDPRYLSNTKKYKKKIKTFTNDIKNIYKYKKHLNKIKPEIIVHLAAQPFVGDSYLNTSKTYETNIFGTIKKTNLSKDKNEQRTDRFAIDEQVDSIIISIDQKTTNRNLKSKTQ